MQQFKFSEIAYNGTLDLHCKCAKCPTIKSLCQHTMKWCQESSKKLKAESEQLATTFVGEHEWAQLAENKKKDKAKDILEKRKGIRWCTVSDMTTVALHDKGILRNYLVDFFGRSLTMGKVPGGKYWMKEDASGIGVNPGGTGKLNCCGRSCGPATEYGTRPLLRNQEALAPVNTEKWQREYGKVNKGRMQFRLDRLRNHDRKGRNDAYPAHCPLPKDGVPEGAHLLRIALCHGDHPANPPYSDAMVFCALVKITIGQNPVVEGFSEITRAESAANIPGDAELNDAFRDKIKQEKLMKMCPDLIRNNDTAMTNEKAACLEPFKEGTLRSAVVDHADGIVRAAIAALRFSLGKRQLV